MSLHQGQIQKILKEGLCLGNTNLTCLPIPRLKLICDTGYRILEYLCREIMARPWNTVIIDFRRTSSFKINNQKNPQTNGRAVPAKTRHSQFIIVEMLADFFFHFPYSVDFEDVYSQPNAWNQHCRKAKEAIHVFVKWLSLFCVFESV